MLDAFYRVMGITFFMMGDYDATITWTSKAGSEFENYGRLGAVRLAALAHLGCETEMKQARDLLLNHIPHITVPHALLISPKFGPPYEEGLRKAGLLE